MIKKIQASALVLALFVAFNVSAITIEVTSMVFGEISKSGGGSLKIGGLGVGWGSGGGGNKFCAVEWGLCW